MKNIFILFASMVLLFSCSKGTDEVATNSSIELNASQMTFDYTGVAVGEKSTIKVKSSAAWTLVLNSTWCKPSKMSGVSGDEVTFTLTPNSDDVTRELVVAFVCGDKSSKMTVRQLPKIKFGVAGDVKEYIAEGGANGITVKFISNVPYTCAVQEEAKDWLIPDIGRQSGGEDWVVMDVAANTTYLPRSALVTFKSAEYDDYTIVVNQKQNDAMIVDKKVVDLSYEGDSFEVIVKSNIDYNFTIQASSQSWLRAEGEPVVVPDDRSIEGEEIQI